MRMTPILSWWAFLENENSEKRSAYRITLVGHCKLRRVN